MVANIVSNDSQIFWIVFSCAILILFSVFLGLRHRAKKPAGSKGHRPDKTTDAEQARPDGYIDSFADEIEEAGGGLTPVVWAVLVTVLAWWAAYIVIYWKP